MTAKAKRLAGAEPIRRANKPLMEKRRRARINQSLAALKTLILDSAKADNTKHSKLEKADILELTVRHFQRHRSLDVKGINQYKAGYADCVREVQRYLETPDAQTMTVVDTGVRQRLLRHLDNCVSEVDVDLRQATALAPPPPVEERLQQQPSPQQQPPPPQQQQQQQHPDSSSSTLEEVNNNNNSTNNNSGGGTTPPRLVEVKTEDPKAIKNYDGNFVLLLPEHYVQLANALGVNLRQEATEEPPTEPSPGPSSSKSAEESDEVRVKVEKPLDFSKGNEQVDSMWRPW